MQLRTYIFIKDIGEYGQMAMELVRTSPEADFTKDDRTYYAVERLLFIVGEAVVAAIQREPAIEEFLSNTADIKRFRDLLAHGYFRVDRREVAKICADSLPLLISEASKIPEPVD